MLYLLSSLMVLLSFVGSNNGDCRYFQNLNSGQTYYVYNPDYPKAAEGEQDCQWAMQSSRDQPIQLNCSINLTYSDKCSATSLTIEDGYDNVKRTHCGYGNVALVTKSDTLTLTFKSSTESSAGTVLCEIRTEKEFNELTCDCGWKKVTRIVGGIETGVNEYPMMAGIVDSTKAESEMVYCGATIINQKQMITAAHCIADKDVTKIGVVVGEHDVTTGKETNATKMFRVQEAKIHPSYESTGVTTDYDVAIVTIDGTIEYSVEVGPACLPFQHFRDSFAGDHVDVLGWGLVEFAGRKSNTLQKASLSVINNTVCSQSTGDLTTRQLCTLTEGKDSCQMDSGGPILWENPTSHNLVLVGIISSGDGCASDKPAVNTRVGAFIDFILSEAPPGEQYCKVE